MQLKIIKFQCNLINISSVTTALRLKVSILSYQKLDRAKLVTIQRFMETYLLKVSRHMFFHQISGHHVFIWLADLKLGKCNWCFHTCQVALKQLGGARSQGGWN